MQHRIHADPWYRQAAQTVLNNADIPDLYAPTHHGHTSATVMFSGTDARLIIMVGTRIGGRLVDDLARWTAARDQVAALFTQAGYPEPRSSSLGLVLTVPEGCGTPARVRLERTSPGSYTAHIHGHPDLVAEIDGQLHIPTSRGYTLHTRREQHCATYNTEQDAARAFAFDCGFGPHIDVTI